VVGVGRWSARAEMRFVFKIQRCIIRYSLFAATTSNLELSTMQLVHTLDHGDGAWVLDEC
jgi:hypothetical protein